MDQLLKKMENYAQEYHVPIINENGKAVLTKIVKQGVVSINESCQCTSLAAYFSHVYYLMNSTVCQQIFFN